MNKWITNSGTFKGTVERRLIEREALHLVKGYTWVNQGGKLCQQKTPQSSGSEH
jgi:hypothetical protein